ncbi:MAG TPA: hypothetical protein VE961_08050 [Pyrinomonadaceae bacterium]|nr:hypothetical protein [Pyrinomonadaceae bacterium]
MKELFWAIVALIALLTLVLITLGLRAVPLNKSALGVSNVFEDGLLFGLFALLFAPIYLAWMGGQSVWRRIHPPPALPTEGDDPVWGRKINRQVVETAFLAVADARMHHNANLAKRFIGEDLFKSLRRECSHANAGIEAQPRKRWSIDDVLFTDEGIEKGESLCHLSATVKGVILPVAKHNQPETATNEAAEEFEAHLEFERALPEVKDARWFLMRMSGL